MREVCGMADGEQVINTTRVQLGLATSASKQVEKVIWQRWHRTREGNWDSRLMQ